MAGQLLHSIQMMNFMSMVLFTLCCLHIMCKHGQANTQGGALTVVEQENQDNGDVTVTLESEDGEEEVPVKHREYETFHPTHEWQTVNEGQAIPPGLHVRMNFETGHREAKLMDGEPKIKYWKEGDKEGMMNMDKREFTMNELKRALKDFKVTQLDDTDLQREDEVKKSFRSYEDLKKDMKEMNLSFKTDTEIIQGLLEKMKHADIPRDDLITILVDLEYYLHQIDNAVVFKDLGGLTYLVKFLNRTDDEQVQMEAAMVLGAAMSSNPKVQIGGVESGSIELLLRLMSTQSSLKLRRKVLFALAAQCRHFPYAQRRFLDLGGLNVLRKMFEEPGTDKLQIKTVSFLNDLLIEKVLTQQHSSLDKSSEAEKLRQYQEVLLKESMIEQGWCNRLTHLLTLPDHDSREITLNTMTTLVEPCRHIFLESQDSLATLHSEYWKLAKEDDDDDSEDSYFKTIALLIKDLINLITRNNVHDPSEL